MSTIRGRMDAKGKRIAVVVSRWNELITKELLEGAVDEIERHGASAEVVHVPGTWEIPVAAKALLDRAEAKRPHGIVALGCILQGQTPHAKLLGGDVGSALMGLQVSSGVPIGWGILTPDTQEQALERAGLKMGNKGREAALATLEMVSVTSQIR
ncbi:MAG: 6,7-dimethyl-8-ribityllumazine synthase [Fimbriimonadales bacterium]